eukprot:TRINITY_DN113583_c0_g1_i7.p1 TRINITY_DN113583_c0_g1~~TRINITY_DN113583_c0_g1_i7.p1  ORF type:complete len:167 (+),score=27.61 TRINITY_DN113583_c0_g1_i7:40-540(+)
MGGDHLLTEERQRQTTPGRMLSQCDMEDDSKGERDGPLFQSQQDHVVGEKVSGATIPGTADADQGCAQSDVHHHSSEDVLTSVRTPCTSEAEHDPSQTMAKQFLDPWETAEDGQSKMSPSPCGQAQVKPPHDQTPEVTNLTFVKETASTPVRRPLHGIGLNANKHK